MKIFNSITKIKIWFKILIESYINKNKQSILISLMNYQKLEDWQKLKY